ncbi:MAG: rRNA-processing protein and EBNA1-binding protein ebp2 [Phylliscum demangeonii]|nr:MAG: rRNA-processing protein and EBNA1-binding protein ebp2 [Phylliscum demangeonii]
MAHRKKSKAARDAAQGKETHQSNPSQKQKHAEKKSEEKKRVHSLEATAATAKEKLEAGNAGPGGNGKIPVRKGALEMRLNGDEDGEALMRRIRDDLVDSKTDDRTDQGTGAGTVIGPGSGEEKEEDGRMTVIDFDRATTDAGRHKDGEDDDEVEEDEEDGKEGEDEEDDDDEEDGNDGKDELEENQINMDIAHLDDTDSESEIENVRPTPSERPSDPTAPDEGAVSDNSDPDADEDDVPFSDLSSLSSTAKEDLVPHQRLTINNTSALLRSLNTFALPLSKLPFSEHQSITSQAPISIADVDDDLTRELAFYKQSLDAVRDARRLLEADAVPFARPPDYFAEMVKTDEHMGRVQSKLVDDASHKKAAADARKQRDLKKFGKQVQVAKLQERDKAKRETLDRIQSLKRKRRDATSVPDHAVREPTSLFDDVEVDTKSSENARPHKRARLRHPPEPDVATPRPRAHPHSSRAKRDQTHGFGGKKRFAKSGDARSSGDLTAFSTRKMKMKGAAGPGPGGREKMKPKARLGKSKRVKGRAG